MWRRVDVPGSEIVFLEDGDQLRARGWQHAIDPVPYALTYELRVDHHRRHTHLAAHAEGQGWTRGLELTRSDGEWTFTSTAHGAPGLASFDGERLRPPASPGFPDATALRDAVDVDIGGSPLTNALPVRRLGMLEFEANRTTQLTAAWVLPPTLEVVDSLQTYCVKAADLIAYGDDPATALLIRYDEEGWVTDYQDLAERVF